MKLLLLTALFITLGSLLFGCTANTAAGNTKTVEENKSEKSKWPEKLVMGFLPNEDSDEGLKGSGKILQNEMSEYLGIPVEIVIAEDYNAVIEAMRNNKAQLASFGPFSYIIAHERSSAEAIVVMAKEGKKENAFYNSYLVTHPSTGIETIEDIKGKSMAFVDPASTSGNLVPRSIMVAKFGITPEEIDTKLFSSVQFAGNHQNSILAAANKSVEVAAVDSSTYDRSIDKDVVKQENIKIIFKSDPIPSSPIAVRSDLPQDLKDKIKE